MDGVFTMQDFHAQGGFVFSRRNMRFRAEIAQGQAASQVDDAGITPLSAVAFAQVAEYDRTCFPAMRPSFLRGWISQPPVIGHALRTAGHEVAGHGYRWVDYHEIEEEEERRHVRLTIDVIERVCGKRPVGWYTGRVSPNTRRLLREDGGFLYSSDAYNDDLPYWLDGSPAHLIIPYTLVNNDARYLLPNGFASGEDFFRLLKDAFDVLWQEGAQRPKMMSVGLHARTGEGRR